MRTRSIARCWCTARGIRTWSACRRGAWRRRKSGATASACCRRWPAPTALPGAGRLGECPAALYSEALRFAWAVAHAQLAARGPAMVKVGPPPPSPGLMDTIATLALPDTHGLAVIGLALFALVALTRPSVPQESTSLMVLMLLVLGFEVFPYEGPPARSMTGRVPVRCSATRR
jgi:hypothetical protein